MHLTGAYRKLDVVGPRTAAGGAGGIRLGRLREKPSVAPRSEASPVGRSVASMSPTPLFGMLAARALMGSDAHERPLRPAPRPPRAGAGAGPATSHAAASAARAGAPDPLASADGRLTPSLSRLSAWRVTIGPACGSWWSTTSRRSATRSIARCGSTATTSRSRTTAARRSTRWPPRRPTRSCWTCSCRRSTAWRSAAGCAPPATARPCSCSPRATRSPTACAGSTRAPTTTS